jgi:SprT protein
MNTIQPIGKAKQEQVIEEVNRYIQLASGLYRRAFPKIDVLFNLSGKSAGIYRCYYEKTTGNYHTFWMQNLTALRARKKQEIRFNPWLFAKYPDDSWHNTIPHEVAHYISDCCFGLNNIKPHGREWQQIMEDFEAEPLVRANYDLDGIPLRRITRYKYTCGCRDVELTAHRHNKIQRGKQVYQCRDCSQPLVLSV